MWIRILKDYNGKEVVFGIASNPINLRYKSGDIIYSKEDYYDLELSIEEYQALGVKCYDSWNKETKTNIKDSYLRDVIPEKTELELLKERVDEMDLKIKNLEKREM